MIRFVTIRAHFGCAESGAHNVYGTHQSRHMMALYTHVTCVSYVYHVLDSECLACSDRRRFLMRSSIFTITYQHCIGLDITLNHYYANILCDDRTYSDHQFMPALLLLHMSQLF